MIEHILTSTILILAVMMLRGLFHKKIPKRLCYAMWLVVGLKLLVPATTIPNDFHMMNLVYAVMDMQREEAQNTNANEQNQENTLNIQSESSNMDEKNETVNVAQQSQKDDVENGKMEDGYGKTNTEMPQSADDLKTENNVGQQEVTSAPYMMLKLKEAESILLVIWLLGISVCGLSILLSNLIFAGRLRKKRRRLKAAEVLQQADRIPVYVTEEIRTPCLFGLFHPAIYVTEECLQNHEYLQYIMEHEMTHYRHRDYIWSGIRCLCVVLYWYHPLVWIAARISMVDSELACDEGVLNGLSDMQRTAYGEMLIAISTDSFHTGNPLLCATGITNTKRELKHRIYGITGKQHYKKGTFLLLAMLLFGITGCTFGSAVQKEDTSLTKNTELKKTVDEEKTEEYHNDSVVVVKDGIIVRGNEEWESFKKKCRSQVTTLVEPIRITIEVQVDDSSSSTVISYDGEHYICNGRKWKYLLDVTGKDGIPEREARQAALANDVYTYEELQWSVLSSNSNDWIDHEFLFYVLADSDSDVTKKSGLDESDKNIRLYAEPVEGEVCIAFEPPAYQMKAVEENTQTTWYYVVGNEELRENRMQTTWYYVVEDETLRTKLETALKSIEPVNEEKSDWWNTYKSLGCSVWYEGRKWQLYSENRLYTYVEKENGESAGYLETPDTNWNCVNVSEYVLGILKDEFCYEPVDIASWTNLLAATLDYYDNEKGQSYSQTITDRDVLEKLQTWFSDAEYIRGGTGCPFYNAVLTLELEDGKTVKLQMAEDDCSVFQVNGVYYDYRPAEYRGQSWLNDELYKFFDEVPVKPL